MVATLLQGLWSASPRGSFSQPETKLVVRRAPHGQRLRTLHTKAWCLCLLGTQASYSWTTTRFAADRLGVSYVFDCACHQLPFRCWHSVGRNGSSSTERKGDRFGPTPGRTVCAGREGIEAWPIQMNVRWFHYYYVQSGTAL